MTPTAPFAPPPAPRPELRRARLEAAIAEAASPVLSLLAPGGYGKTCALRAWLLARGGPAAWLAAGEPQPGAFRAAAEAARGGWVVVDGLERLDLAAAAELAQAIAEPSGARWILAGRHGRGLPLARWRSQGLLAPLDGRALALDVREWEAAGLDDDGAAWGGWWGARLAAARPERPADPDLVAWIAEAWLDDLADATLAEIAQAALLGTATPGRLAALAGRPEHEAAATLAALAGEAGPLSAGAGGGLEVAPRLRPAVLAAWRGRDAAGFSRAVSQGVAALLARREDEVAGRIALESGAPPLQARVLAEAGWRLLYAVDREVLRALLDRRPPVPEALREELESAWQIEAAKRPHLADAALAARLPALHGPARGAALALGASIAAQYDDLTQAGASAAEARLVLGEAPHPALMLASWIEGTALVEAGRLAEAEPPLRRALGAAVRDALPRAELEAWVPLAHLAAERDDDEALAAAVAGCRRAAGRAAIRVASPLDSVARLEAARALQALDAAAARAALARGAPAASTFGAEQSFPHRTLRAVVALVEGDDAALSDEVAGLERELSQRFLCVKWRAEALLPRVALRARRADREGLRRLAAEPDARPWPPGVRRDRRDLTLCGARLLAGEPLDAGALAHRAEGWRAAGCLALAHDAELLAALAHRDPDALLAHVCRSARRGAALPYLWLAPACVGALEALLGHARLAHDEPTRVFLRSLVQRLLAPPPASVEVEGTAAPAAPPGDLTVREWEILRLIGGRYTNDQIAARLCVSLATVKTHINRVYAKLGIRTRAEAVLRARTVVPAEKPRGS